MRAHFRGAGIFHLLADGECLLLLSLVVMTLILKTLVGVVVGLGYGVLVGGLLLLISFVADDPPVDLISTLERSSDS